MTDRGADDLLGTIRTGLDAIPAGVAVWSGERRLAYCNRAFREALNPAPGAIHDGMAFLDFLRLVGRSNEWILPGGADEWVAAEEGDFGVDKSHEIGLADGRTVEVVQRAIAAGGMVTTVNDVTAVKRSEGALRRAKEAAEATDEAKSRFLRAANHDLRQPLATLKILIYGCMSEQDPEHRADMLHAMDIAASVMEDLLGALLQIGQLDAGRIQPRVTTFQLAQVFERLAIQFRHQAQEKGLTLRFVSSRSTVTTDRALLERILSNLLANAIRYTELGGIVVGCRRAGRALRIEVTDTGRGIASEHQERIFDEFYRIPDNARRQKTGLGLGLNIVRRLGDLLGHPVTLRSVPGRGSVFAVTVPVGNVWLSDMGEPEISETIGGEFVGIRVLLIEDDDVLRQTMKQLLERWGIEVLAAADEAAALREVGAGRPPPRLIIADYTLKQRTGVAIVAAIRRAAGIAIPAIVVTADTEPRVVAHVREAGLPILIKPVSPPRLRVLMHNLLFEPRLAAAPPANPPL
ncbi:hybrid sensor histidine kinase/response regulator [Chelatococcus reniformis]|uniref:histidine kinase n=1 Tax=Chelatococcus reniformis TaxID=1494448 RepID=A0A916UM66_9HYPH|nr:ATP-binding protein [Chelatococcus reniformis]GGC77128.1 hypothetical protein GCM10010994_39290 [Chelatococcus reniformis]